jgi:hypothetical protein
LASPTPTPVAKATSSLNNTTNTTGEGVSGTSKLYDKDVTYTKYKDCEAFIYNNETYEAVGSIYKVLKIETNYDANTDTVIFTHNDKTLKISIYNTSDGVLCNEKFYVKTSVIENFIK